MATLDGCSDQCTVEAGYLCTGSPSTCAHVTITSSNPATTAQTPAQNRQPTLLGTAPTGAALTVFEGTSCSGPATTVVLATSGNTWSVALTNSTQASADGTTLFTALADDDAGSTLCSAPFSYFTDNTPPSGAITSSSPLTTASAPSRNLLPMFSGTAEAGASVTLYEGSACTGASSAPTTATGGMWSLSTTATIQAAADGTTTYSALVTDAAGNTYCSPPFSYYTDNTAPAGSIGSSNPATSAAGPSQNRLPVFMGTAEAGASVTLYASNSCIGGSAGPTTAAGGLWSIATTVSTEAILTGVTSYTALVADAAGNTHCSSSFSYYTDNNPPAGAITSSNPATSPASPSTNRFPTLSGTAEAGASVTLYVSGSCTGSSTGPTTAAGGTWSIATTVSTEALATGTTTYAALVSDAAGNTHCTSAFAYYTN